MILTGKFVFISAEKNERDGKVYHSVNMECVADGQVHRFNAVESEVLKMKKYQTYNCHLDVRSYTYQGQTRTSFNLVDVDALPPITR